MDNSWIKSCYHPGLLLGGTFPLRTGCCCIALHKGDAASMQAPQQASCHCLHTTVHCRMHLLQETEQQEDQKGAKELKQSLRQ